MRKTTLAISIVLCIGLLFLAGCAASNTGYVPANVPSGSGGGCGIGAPSDVPDVTGDAARTVEGATTL